MKKYKKIIIITIGGIALLIAVIIVALAMQGRSEVRRLRGGGLGKVQVESAISGAKISLSSINGNYIEMKDVPFEFEVPEGEYLVVVYAPGFANYQLQIKVNAGESRRVKADLTNVGEDISEGAPI